MKKWYADIIVDISQEKLDRTFQYEIPQNLLGIIKTGTKVEVPFGKGSRTISGYVIGISDKPKIEESKIKPVSKIWEKGIEIESKLIGLAGWMSREYGCTMNQALKTVKGKNAVITVKAGKNVKITIPKGTYKVTIRVVGKKAAVVNNGTVKEIVVNSKRTVTKKNNGTIK